MQIEIKTENYQNNKNFNVIVDSIVSSGFSYSLNFGGKYGTDGVTITTNAPESILVNLTFTKSAVIIR